MSSSTAASSSVSTCTANGVTYRDGQEYIQGGYTYVIHCSADNSQGAYEVIPVSSSGFSKCFSACNASPKCKGFTYSGTDFGTCYLKEQEGTYLPASSTIVSAFMVGSRPDGGSISMKTSSSTSSVSSTVTSNAPSTTPTVSAFNCGAIGSNDGRLSPYTDQNGVHYQVSCKHDVGGSNLGAASAPTFGDCFLLCDKTSGCAGFAWLQDDGPGTCYFKSGFNDVNTIGSSAADVAIIVGGRTSASASGSVSATGSATKSASTTSGSAAAAGCSSLDNSEYPEYTVECQTDRRGGDLRAAESKSFQRCFGICDELEECIGFSYVGGTGPGTCYLKKELKEPSANANVDTAYKRGNGQQPSRSSSGSVRSETASRTQSNTSNTPSSTPSAGSRSCQQLDGNMYRGYTIECGMDHYGGDLKAVGIGSFEECFGICDSESGCIGFAYVGDSRSGTCYTKSTITAGTKNSGVDFAFKPQSSAAPSSSAAPAPTSSASITVRPEGSASTAPMQSSTMTVKPATSSTQQVQTSTTKTKTEKTKTTTISSTSTAAPMATGFPQCWRTCFEQNNVSSAEKLCDNDDVDHCVHKKCSHEDEVAYKKWRDDHCGSVTTTTSAKPTTMKTKTKTKDKRAAVAMV